MKLVNFIDDETVIDIDKIVGIYIDRNDVIIIDCINKEEYFLDNYTYQQVIKGLEESAQISNYATNFINTIKAEDNNV